MARTGVLAALLLGLGAALLLRQAPAPETPRDRIAPVPPTAALAAGDRIAAIALGTSLTARALWPERLERVLAACGFAAAPVTVMARPGADSGEGPALVAAAGPGPYHLAFIEFAINDADLWDGVSRSESLANHRRIIRDLRSRNPDVAVVMVTTNPVSGLQRLKRPRLMAYNDLYVRLAGDENVSLFDGSARWASPTPPRTALPDGLHPDPEAEAALYTPPLAALVAGIFGHACAP